MWQAKLFEEKKKKKTENIKTAGICVLLCQAMKARCQCEMFINSQFKLNKQTQKANQKRVHERKIVTINQLLIECQGFKPDKPNEL